MCADIETQSSRLHVDRAAPTRVGCQAATIPTTQTIYREKSVSRADRLASSSNDLRHTSGCSVFEQTSWASWLLTASSHHGIVLTRHRASIPPRHLSLIHISEPTRPY